MTPAAILNEAGAAGVTLWLEGETLRYRGPREALTADLLHRLKAHKPAILAALARTNADALWWRVAITETGGRTVEVETPPAGPWPTGKPTPSPTTALGAP